LFAHLEGPALLLVVAVEWFHRLAARGSPVLLDNFLVRF
jgi:hypothetical protein